MSDVIQIKQSNPIGAQILNLPGMLRGACGSGGGVRTVVAQLGNVPGELVNLAGVVDAAQEGPLRDLFESAMILLSASEAQLGAMSAADVKTHATHLVILMATVVPSNT